MINTDFDILPQEQKYWNFLKKNIRYRLREAGFQRINPFMISRNFIDDTINEYSRLHYFRECSVVLSDDKIVVPDLTLAILRCFHDNKMYNKDLPVQLFAIEQIIFKKSNEIVKEHLFDFEIIGERDPALDAELVSRAYKILLDCGLKESVVLEINTLGDEFTRSKIDDQLYNFYFDKLRTLPNECHKLFENKRYLELVNYPDEDCQILSKLIPDISSIISQECKDYFKIYKEYLDELGIEYKDSSFFIDSRFNSTGPIFRFKDKDSGTVLIEGGRYDDLSMELFNQKFLLCSAKGYMSNIIELIKKNSIFVPYKDKVQVFVAQLGPKAKKKSLSLLRDLRDVGIHTMGSIGKSSMNTQLKLASLYEAEYCILLGDQEVVDGMILVKDMRKGTQERFKYKDIISILINKLGKESIIHFRDKIYE